MSGVQIVYCDGRTVNFTKLDCYHLNEKCSQEYSCHRSNVISEITIYSGYSVSIQQDNRIVWCQSNDTSNPLTFDVKIKVSSCTKICVEDLYVFNEWDFIIVGLGSAGCILARKLTDDNRTRVLVIEAGSNTENDPVINFPIWQANANTLLINPKYAETYPFAMGFLETAPYSEGRGWGGSSSHNFLLAYRGTPDVYDDWAIASGDSSWSYNQMLSVMKAVENYTPNGTLPDLVQRGVGGPISVSQFPPVDQTNPMMIQYNTLTGVPFQPDYNDPPTGNLCISALQELITPPAPPVIGVSKRSYSAVEFLPVGTIVSANGMGLYGRKLKIVSEASVSKFTLTKHRYPNQIFYVKNGEGFSAKVKKGGELILASGNTTTPQILLNSGIGPAAQLTPLGIPVIVDSPNVGQNMKAQYGPQAVMTGTTSDGAEVLLSGLGTVPPNGLRRVEIINSTAGPNLVSILGILVDPQSIGNVTLANSNTNIQPVMNIGLYNDVSGQDQGLALGFLLLMAEIAQNTGQTMISPPPCLYPAPFGPQPNNDALISYMSSPSGLVVQSHNVGTARMGTSILNGVVDNNLKVFGLNNVRVCSIAVCPRPATGNTCLSAYYIALKLLQKMGYLVPPAL